jgi:hypothetical protein
MFDCLTAVDPEALTNEELAVVVQALADVEHRDPFIMTLLAGGVLWGHSVLGYSVRRVLCCCSSIQSFCIELGFGSGAFGLLEQGCPYCQGTGFACRMLYVGLWPGACGRAHVGGIG